MVLWLIGVLVVVILWGRVWRSQPKAAFGALLGLPIAWILSRLIKPYVTGMNEIPLWLPPLPLAIIATTLFVFGVIIWFRADSLGPPNREEPDDHASPDHTHH